MTKTIQKPEIAYLIQNVLPLLNSQYDFPSPEDEEHVKIDEIPVQMGGGPKKPDVVYYWNDVPVFLVEAKREGKSEEKAILQALSYIKCYPVEKFSKDGIRPRYFAVTIGKRITFYVRRYEIDEKGILKDWAEKIDHPLLFDQILEEYGLRPILKIKTLTATDFKKELLYELVALYKFDDKITPGVAKNVSQQILSFLEYGDNFTSHQPYTPVLDSYKDRQAQIRQLFKKFDLMNSFGPELAKEFRSFILRAFQGTDLNQYLTEQCVIAFMLDLIGEIPSNAKVLDFESGSSGFLAGAIEKGKLPMENIRGIDIDELPYIVAKTYIAIYFKKFGKEQIDAIPIYKGNGLFYQGDDWDLVVGNPAGSNIYEHGNEERILKEGLINLRESAHTFSEYEFSIQQAVRSAKIGSKICIILPEGFFSNSHDEFLRKIVATRCKIEAIIGLPRGVFKKGTSTRSQQRGAQTASMKMSILYGEKVKHLENNVDFSKIDFKELDYPVFLANIAEPESKAGTVCDWLEPRLNLVYGQWREWQKSHCLMKVSPVKFGESVFKPQKKLSPKMVKLKKTEAKQLKPKEPKTETKISEILDDLLK